MTEGLRSTSPLVEDHHHLGVNGFLLQQAGQFEQV